MEQVISGSITDLFSKGELVFKIVAITKGNATREVGMVTTKEDYEKKLYTHLYNPLLFVIDLPLRLAYLYGCLNNSFKNSKEERLYFLVRRIGDSDWKRWFVVNPYEDRVYTSATSAISFS